MNPAFLLLAALLLPTSPVMAANWHTLQSTPQMLLQADEPEVEESELQAQGKSKKKEKKLTIWSKSTYSRPEQARPGDFFYASAKSHLAINCTKRTHRLLQKIYYAADGQEIKFVHYGEDERIEAIVPDSAEEQISAFACAFRAVKANDVQRKPAMAKSAAGKEKQAGKASQKPGKKADSNKKTSDSGKPKTANSCECPEPAAKVQAKPKGEAKPKS
ncbi:MAG: hypothetical protein C3F18_06530 [Nitrosomonadales bacterium]|nr:MAG: hypothetical protein C3F18_06530 [Nitrosomonadales bacterium]